MNKAGLWFLVALSGSVEAGPFYREIHYNLENERRVETKKECARRFLGNCVEWREIHIDRTITAWTPFQKDVALRALRIVADRFVDPRIMDCAIQNTKHAYWEGAPFKIPDWNSFKSFTFGQRFGIFKVGFPLVNVRVTHMSPPTVGLAYAGNYVDSRFTGNDTGSVRGDFHFDVDGNFLNSANNDNAVAGVMAHEMLHQMTHTHPNGYADENFVVVFQNCLTNNGSYVTTGYGLTAGYGCTVLHDTKVYYQPQELLPLPLPMPQLYNAPQLPRNPNRRPGVIDYEENEPF